MSAPAPGAVRAITYARSSSAREKSMDEQTSAARVACDQQGWSIADELSDGISASRFTDKTRPAWVELMSRLPDVGMIVLWEPSRGDRTLASWISFIDLCRKHNVKIHAIAHGSTYDPRNARHYRTLAEDGVDSAYETDKMSMRLRRGLAGVAERGRPHSRTAYGYERIYHPSTRALVEQRAHAEHAPTVREIFRRLAAGEPIAAIARDLTSRQIPPPAWHAPNVVRWSSQTVAAIARNRAYAGVRVHRATAGATTEHAAMWPALVDDATWYAVARLMADPARRTPQRPRNGRATSLLGNIARCGTCGDVLGVRTHGDGYVYRCCPQADSNALDALVTEVILARLSDPAVYAQLRHASDIDDRAAVESGALVDRLTGELAAWRDSAVRGETSPGSLAAVEAGLGARIADAKRSAARASAPPALRGIVGPDGDVRARWFASSLGTQRDIAKTLLVVTLFSSRGAVSGSELHDRVKIEWR